MVAVTYAAKSATTSEYLEIRNFANIIVNKKMTALN